MIVVSLLTSRFLAQLEVVISHPSGESENVVLLMI